MVSVRGDGNVHGDKEDNISSCEGWSEIVSADKGDNISSGARGDNTERDNTNRSVDLLISEGYKINKGMDVIKKCYEIIDIKGNVKMK